MPRAYEPKSTKKGTFRLFLYFVKKFKCRSTDTEEKENFNYVTYPKIVKSNGTYR